MAAELTFKLKDKYSMMIWNPRLLNNDNFKSITAEYFFSVLFSVYREKSSDNKNFALHAKKISSKFTLEIESFEKEVSSQIRILELEKSNSVFGLKFDGFTEHNITFSPNKNSGVCPENAAFLRAFVKFDEFVSLLNEVHTMAILNDNEFYRQRKLTQGKLRGIMEGYNNLIKEFHIERKKLKNVESVA